VKKIFVILAALVVLFALVGCASEPTAPAPAAPAPEKQVKVYPPQILEHKGTAYGMAQPAWLEAALSGPKAVEKLPDYANQYIVIVEASGQDLRGAQLAAENLEARTVIAGIISTRVKDTFAGAEVGDKDKIETYMERCVKVAAEARYSGFAPLNDTWSKLQTFTTDGKPDKQVYRVIQLWGIPKDTLQKQVEAILSGEAANEPKTPEKVRAMDMVQQSFFEGF
jgi:hypothetical protein